jgi:cation:H+ antiporter
MDQSSTTVLIAVFLVAVAVTWVAGIFLSDCTDVVDDRFGLGQALGGLILLGIAGTRPEIAITVSGALQGDLSLVTGNLLGGIAMQTLVLVLLDALSRSPTPLSALSKVLEPIIEAILVILLVTIALLGPLLPSSVAFGPVSPISILIVIAWLGGLLILDRLRKSERWSVVSEQVDTAMVMEPPKPARAVRPNRYESKSTRAVLVAFIVAAVATLVAGVGLQQSSGALANRWASTASSSGRPCSPPPRRSPRSAPGYGRFAWARWVWR